MRGSPSSRFGSFLRCGTRLRGGYRKLSAYINTRRRGTRILETATTAGCNFSLPLIVALEDGVTAVLTLTRHGSNYTVHGSSTGSTVTPGASGARLQLAGYGDALDRARAACAYILDADE